MPSLWPAVLFALPVLALQHDCENVVIDKQHFNFGPLRGAYSVHDLDWSPPTIVNWTYTLDICKPLEDDHNLPAEERCSPGTYVCAKEFDYNTATKIEQIKEVRAIAGQYPTSNGRRLDPKYTRLKHSSSNSEAELEGVRIELNGGSYPIRGRNHKQKAVIEFLCDRDLTGLEGLDDATERADSGSVDTRRGIDANAGEDQDDGDVPNLGNPDKGKSLQFVSYKEEGDDETGVLRLEWRTKYACEGASKDTPNDKSKSGGWGFFTWFLIILFLLAAAYIIFGSWLNYNRYGARGWDLVPHGDTIRDLPYIVKDWGHGAVDRLKGGSGGRGGYSAV